MIGPFDSSNKPLTELQRTHDKLSITQQRLATGFRINRAEDDSAGLSISSRLQSHIRGLTQGLENGEPVVVEGESVSAEALGLDDVSLADGASARDALESLSDARDSLAAVRSSFSTAAVDLRESRNHVADKVSSLSAANSRIIDADFARESTELVRLQILADAGLAAAAQSNAERQSVLNLLA